MIKINVLADAGFHKCSTVWCNRAAPPHYQKCSRCRERQLHHQRAHRATYGSKDLDRYYRRAEAVAAYKLEHGCCVCGYNKCPSALVFHHRDATKKEIEVSKILVGKEATLWEEIAKCDVMCSNCHRELHHEERKRKRASA